MGGRSQKETETEVNWKAIGGFVVLVLPFVPPNGSCLQPLGVLQRTALLSGRLSKSVVVDALDLGFNPHG